MEALVIPLLTERTEEMITAVIERCAGIDVGKKSLSVCVMVGPAWGSPARAPHVRDDHGGINAVAGVD